MAAKPIKAKATAASVDAFMDKQPKEEVRDHRLADR